jgi:2-methylcitrate dehydratase PrpD
MMDIYTFIHQLSWEDLPPEVRSQARRCLLDTLGAAITGRGTPASEIIHEHAAVVFQGQGAYLWQDGREVSPLGAALANGMTIDCFDIHDGYKLIKGHAGVAIVPAVFATLRLGLEQPVSGKELLATLVIGYEIALRAGVALHSTTSDYHSSGAWNALGCAAVTARRLRLEVESTRHALGIAEYHAPRSQIMRSVEYPTMVKDGSGWGAMAGVSAGMLAKCSESAGGFTGAPAITVESEYAAGEDREVIAEVWSDLGSRWRILEVYFKPYAVCYWAQPAIVGALALQAKYQIQPREVSRIRVFTFYQATCLKSRSPANTEEAQYSLSFPVAAALVHGRLGLAELSGAGLSNALTLELAERIELVEDPKLSAQFPAQRYARVEIETRDGRRFDSGERCALWEPSAPPTDDELTAKFRWLAEYHSSKGTVAELESMIWNCSELPDVGLLERLLR